MGSNRNQNAALVVLMHAWARPPRHAAFCQRAYLSGIPGDPRLGWVQDGGPLILLVESSMKAGTVMQLSPQLSALRAKHWFTVCAGCWGAGSGRGSGSQAAGAFAGTL